MRPLVSDHPIRGGAFAYDLEQVAYRPALKKERPELSTPELSGVDLNGRTAIVFSRWGIGCGLEDHQC